MFFNNVDHEPASSVPSEYDGASLPAVAAIQSSAKAHRNMKVPDSDRSMASGSFTKSTTSILSATSVIDEGDLEFHCSEANDTSTRDRDGIMKEGEDHQGQNRTRMQNSLRSKGSPLFCGIFGIVVVVVVVVSIIVASKSTPSSSPSGEWSGSAPSNDANTNTITNTNNTTGSSFIPQPEMQNDDHPSAHSDCEAENTGNEVQNSMRNSTVAEIIHFLTNYVDGGVSSLLDLQQCSTPQRQAVEWLAYHDPSNVPVPTLIDAITQDTSNHSVTSNDVVSVESSRVSDEKQRLMDERYDYLVRYVMALNFYALQGSSWVLREFLTNQNVCQWSRKYMSHYESVDYGVQCLYNAREIREIKLNSNRLHGTIPTENGLLSTLETLDFNDNELFGSIPTEICQLTKLRTLALSNNDLTGTLPDCFYLLSDLRFLYLSNNHLNGTLPQKMATLGALDNLRSIVLDGNNFQGDVSNHFNHLIFLKTLLVRR
jgi:Leucine-rich repeat (LRR) protein